MGLTSSYKAVGRYGRCRQTGDGGDHSGHQDDTNGQSCFTKTWKMCEVTGK